MNFQHGISYPDKLSFINEGKIKFFMDKQALRDFINTSPALQELWKKHYTQKGTISISHPKTLPKGKEYLHNEESISTNGQNSQIALNDNIKLTNININPKFKWIKCPNQKHRQANWIKSQNPSVRCIQIHLISKNTQRLKTKYWRKTHQSNGEKKQNKTKQEL